MRSFLYRNGWWLTIIVAIIAVNFLASIFHQRIDLTNEKRFTISKPVKKILKNINSKVEVAIFLKGDLPSGFKNYQPLHRNFYRNLKNIQTATFIIK